MDLISSAYSDDDGAGTPISAVHVSPEIATSPEVQVLSPATQATTLIQEQLDGSGSQIMDFVMNDFESNDVTDDYLVAIGLPPPTKAKCSDKLQERINEFIYHKQRGRSFNAEVRNKKDYRNPDFLRHVVTYEEIDEIGSCFGKDVFDPHGYDKSDFYDELEADMKRESERKVQEMKKNQKAEFLSGGAQSRSIPISAVPTVNRSKKSKWDEVFTST